jgi:hypothetical protein
MLSSAVNPSSWNEGAARALSAQQRARCACMCMRMCVCASLPIVHL